MTPENPSAFPLNPTNDGTPGAFCSEPGMTLRDYFAGQALAGLLGNDLDGPPGKGIAGHTDHFAILSYRYADAMLAARATTASKEGE